MMVPFYRDHVAGGKAALEVVFVSADRDRAQFEGYLGEMPWLAVDYDDPRREKILAMYKVKGIPKLMVFAKDGRLVAENAAGGAVDAAAAAVLDAAQVRR
eukprot:CAMPEP_0174909208 /NCGR_PEP_ID=MMETSP0167-20121228/67569_1 /TAXON_ID=38298 /ORGANISM="Rhodella maculata, Strain CCMP736" /LENGTH=99 /DNA_ID=CAMNT_0016153133 /DNA_START=9 /DNA_END=303 /DNA_ORIENTATION=+